ncbi:hypothetical protein PS1_019706 [Malus domestica]
MKTKDEQDVDLDGERRARVGFAKVNVGESTKGSSQTQEMQHWARSKGTANNLDADLKENRIDGMGVRVKAAMEAVMGGEGFQVEELETRGRQVAGLNLQDGLSHKEGLGEVKACRKW